MLVADGRLLVVTREGTLYCFDDSSKVNDAPHVHGQKNDPATDSDPSKDHRGYALIVGLKDGQLVRSLVENQQRRGVAIESDDELVERLRAEFDAEGMYGTHVSILHADLNGIGLPQFFASIITTEDPERFVTVLTSVDNKDVPGSSLHHLLESLRPFGGEARIPLTGQQWQRMEPQLEHAGDAGLQVSVEDGATVVRRTGALPGSSNYRGGWKESRDQRVRFPLGVLWFDDTLGHFKRSPQPEFVDGMMVSYSKNWHVPMIKGLGGRDYPLNEAELSDVYTGRVFGPDEATAVRASQRPLDPDKREPSQYRPPYQKNDWSPGQPRPGRRVNPLTGKEEVRAFPKTYGCDGGVDYGDFYTMRSGTAAFYDKTLESGTVFISGPRSGCTNSVIPANGVLNVPYYYEGCTCSYPLPVGLSLVTMPERYEQWASWGDGKADVIQRIGINFGAPGDRTTRDGTLWLDYPSVGGPSPAIDSVATPESVTYRYRHSLFVKDGQGWPWVLASSAEGLGNFTLKNVKPGLYTVRVFFAETGNSQPGERVQSVTLQGQDVVRDIDIAAEAGGSLRGLVREFTDIKVDNELRLTLTAREGRTLISGIELIANGLKRADVPVID